MLLPEDNDMIDTLSTRRANEAFDERIQIRTPSWQPHDVHTGVAQQLAELVRVERVANEEDVIADQTAERNDFDGEEVRSREPSQ